MAVNVKTAPPVEPVTLEEARVHCRLYPADSVHPDDAFLERAIQAARENAEDFMQRTIIETEFEWHFDEFPRNADKLTLPRNPALSVESIGFTDKNGDAQTVTGFVTQFTRSESVVVPAFGAAWPVSRGYLGDVTVTFKAGYTPDLSSPTDYAANVPASIKNAILLMVGHMYENREAVNIGNITSTVPLAYESLLWPHRIVGV